MSIKWGAIPPGANRIGLCVTITGSKRVAHVGEVIAYSVNISNGAFPCLQVRIDHFHIITPDNIAHDITLHQGTLINPGQSFDYPNVIQSTIRECDAKLNNLVFAVARVKATLPAAMKVTIESSVYCECIYDRKVEPSGKVNYGTETIIIVDLVASTRMASIFGEHIKREQLQTLKEIIRSVLPTPNLQIFKSVGDAFLFTLANDSDATLSVPKGIGGIFEMLNRIRNYNEGIAVERRIAVRFAIHFGEVELQDNDRCGREVDFAFRLEEYSPQMIPKDMDSNNRQDLPADGYIIASATVVEILATLPAAKVQESPIIKMLGMYELKGSKGWHGIYQVEPRSREEG